MGFSSPLEERPEVEIAGSWSEPELLSLAVRT